MKLSDLRGKFHTHFAQLRHDIYATLTSGGHFTGNPEKVRGGYVAVGIIVAAMGIFFMFVLGRAGFISFGVGLILAAIPVFAFAKFMPARTLKGAGYDLGVVTPDADNWKYAPAF